MLGDGQLFFDFRNESVIDFWATQVALGAVASDAVDGIFVDDPFGFGQEHPQIQDVSGWRDLQSRTHNH